MTIREKLVDLLFQNGIFENDAKEIVQSYIDCSMGQAMEGRWDDEVEGYPIATISVLWAGTKAMALEWISKNCPSHWAKPLLES